MTATVLVDSNVLLDVLTVDESWFDWSATALAEDFPEVELIAPDG